MAEKVLKGKRIAVLLETEYIPAEIKQYQDLFQALGAEVDLMSNLWGQDSITFVSDVDKPGEQTETIEIKIDFQKVRLEDYAAVIMAANYTSVRLRWFEAPAGQSRSPEMARQAPAVRFFARAMRDPNIVKVAPCHALWLLTPTAELLTGRKITCNPVVLADIINAGAEYVAAPADQDWDRQVVVDGDLITTPSFRSGDLLVDAVKEAILARSPRPAPAQAPQLPPNLKTERGRRILCVVTEWGYWGEELVGPVEMFDQAGYQVDFCSPKGRRPNAVTVSMDPDYLDPPMARPVTSPEVAAKVALWDDPASPEGRRLENPINLAAWFPRRPYFAEAAFARKLEIYYNELERVTAELDKYDALLLVGGSGPIVDMVNNQRVHDLVLGFYRADKPIAAECHSVGCLVFARDIQCRERSIIWGKRVTGHCLEYDYQDGMGFMKARDVGLDFNMGPPPYTLEYVLRDATGPDGAFIGNFGHDTSVVVDYPFITGRSTSDGYLTGQKIIETLDGKPPLRRWGW